MKLGSCVIKVSSFGNFVLDNVSCTGPSLLWQDERENAKGKLGTNLGLGRDSKSDCH